MNAGSMKRLLAGTIAGLSLCASSWGADVPPEPQRPKVTAAEMINCIMQAGESATDREFCRKVVPPKSLEYLDRKEREQSGHPTLKIGDALPDFALRGVDGKIHKPADYKASSVLVVMFVANHCPVAQLYEPRERRLYEEYTRKGVSFIAIMSDGPKATPIGEMGNSDVDNSFDGMVERAAYRKFPYPYLYDGDEQAAAGKFGPKVTPHIFIFDRARKLRYEGRIDDNLRESQVKSRETRDAIDALLAGQSVPVAHTPVFGCSTSWNNSTEIAQRELKEWQAKPVNVETVTMEGLKTLRANPTGKMLMINFWATWCGPCRTEFPELLTTYQWYKGQSVDFVSVSLDNPQNRSGVQQFLQDVHSPIRNLQVDSEDVYAVQRAFDASWESGVPFTIVLAPDGTVIYRHEGATNVLTLRRAILANMKDRGGPFEGIADYWRVPPQ